MSNTELPEGWKELEINEIVDIANTRLDAIKRAPIVELDTGIKCIRIQDISQNKKFKDWGFTQVEAKNFNKFQLKKNDIVIARTGATIGVNRFIYSDLRSVFNNGLIRIRTNRDYSIPKFLYYSFRTDNFKSFIESISGGTSSQPNMQIKVLLSYAINLPPLAEQKAIAEVLSSLDDKINLLHQQNQTLEDMAQTLFREWFIEKADEGWEEVKLGNLIEPKKGKNITKKQAKGGDYPVVAGGLEPSCYHDDFNTKSPVVTISASGANAGYVRLYLSEVWSSDSSFIDSTITDYVYFFYIFLKINQQILFDNQTGSAQPHIYPAQIMDLDLLKPPKNLMLKFENIVKDIFSKIDTNQKQIKSLEQTRDTLLPKLMSGEVRV